jgi:hypothetical protein
MSNRLWSNLSPAAGRRFWGALNSAPGVVIPGVGQVTLVGQTPVANQPTTIFRTPATAQLTLNGLGIAQNSLLTPAQATLTLSQLVPSKQTIRIITPALPTPDYSVPNALAPTILFIQTVTPAPAALQLQTLTQNVTQGGNIGFIFPGVGLLSAQGQIATFVFGEIGVGGLSIQGLTPSIKTERTITPDVGLLQAGNTPPIVDLAFVWIDVPPKPPSPWVDVGRAA